MPAIELAVSRYAEIATLEAEVADLEERFETRKRVERAKSLLQQKYALTETDAFRWLQKSAMDRRLSMREVADVVIREVTGRVTERSCSHGATPCVERDLVRHQSVIRRRRNLGSRRDRECSAFRC